MSDFDWADVNGHSEPKARPTLRQYQTAILERLDQAIAAGRRRALIPLPTGGGKTVLIAHRMAEVANQGGRAIFLVHRREIVKQAAQHLWKFGIDSGIILPDYPARPNQPIQVASIASLHARAIRRGVMDLPRADLVVLDEAHHCRARTYEAILKRYPSATIVGLTATPTRKDGRGLGNAFDTLIQCPDTAQLIEDGWLVRPTIYAPSRPDLSGLHVRQGDYVEAELEALMNRDSLVGDIVEHYCKHARDRRAVAFATSVGHSKHLRDEFRRIGVVAEHIDGDTPHEERDTILKQLATGTVDVVTNCAVLTEGWDCPDISCLILARPTKSLGLYRQMVGRVLRTAPGKTDAVILDHAGGCFAHGFADDPIIWTLSEDAKAQNNAHASRGEYGGPPALTNCPECGAVRYEGKPCPACGWRPQTKARAVEIQDGSLGEVRRDRSVNVTPDDRQEFYAQLLWIVGEQQYNRGWAAHKFREKFNDWPPRSWSGLAPTPPNAAVRAWVRAKQIAYARRLERERGAA